MLLNSIIRIVVTFLLGLRYSVRVTGLDKVRAKGAEKVLFLPNHPALIDPVIMLSVLHRDFAPRSIGDEFRIGRGVIRRLSRRFGVRLLPDVVRLGAAGVVGVREVLSEAIDGLCAGENLVLYPAGRLKRGYLEEIGATSAVEAILDSVPDVRVVLVRQNGLWGSGFSWAAGTSPEIPEVLKRGLKHLLLNGVFFMPRRQVEIELYEPADFPRSAGRVAMNRFMEDFYNARAWPNMYVPYTFWERGGIRKLPDPDRTKFEADVGSVPPATRRIVLEYLKEITGRGDWSPQDRISYDLGLDSLATAEVILWLEKEFGFPQGNVDSLRTVGDVMLAAAGKGIALDTAALRPPPRKWFGGALDTVLTVPEGSTIPEVFLNQAKLHPGMTIVADQVSGGKTYRDIITAIMVLKPHLEKMPGDYLGIMLPASAGAAIIYLAALFSGKTPVMINWTCGIRNMKHSLDLLGVRNVLTAKALVSRLAAQGLGIEALYDRLVFMEDFRQEISLLSKVGAAVRSYLSWAELRTARPAETAVVLFTSGSESLPKAVPLSHRNIMANVRDVPSMVNIRGDDVLLGMLPPFHSFGTTVTTVLPLCMGLRTVYHPNPTEASALARTVEAYRVSLVVGTPAFLSGMVRAANSTQLQTLRLAVSGAEKCPDVVYEAFRERCPGMKVLEGYGVTECSPVISFNRESGPRPGTIGFAMPSLEYLLVNEDTGRPVGKNETAMLLVRGPSVFGGYLHYEGASPFVECGGKEWYRTGDLVSEDPDGAFTFRGRRKRFVKLGGEMISLPAIEEVLMPHLTRGDEEGPVLAVESTPADENPELILFTVKDTNRETVNAYLRDAGLSALHHIRRVVRVDEIPILGTGKIDYRSLQKLLAGQAGV